MINWTSAAPVTGLSMAIFYASGIVFAVSAIGLSVWQDAVVFLLLIIVLIVKPTGILGRPMTEKV